MEESWIITQGASRTEAHEKLDTGAYCSLLWRRVAFSNTHTFLLIERYLRSGGDVVVENVQLNDLLDCCTW